MYDTFKLIFVGAQEVDEPSVSVLLAGLFYQGGQRLIIYAPCDPFYLHGLTLIRAWISNYINYKVWGEITYRFINFNGATVEV